MKNKNGFLILVKKFIIKSKINMKTKNQRKICYMVNISLVVIVFGLLFSNLIQFTGAASEGFVLRDLNSKLAILKSEHKDLNLESAELQSIDRIKEEIKKLGLILSTERDYISLMKDTIVKR
ncbi:hypothetical protein K8R66_04180 [bacterium]|nr:hypothetical protein [bacterium]